MLKNAKTEYWNEFEEIATYTAIETLAESVGDKDTAKLAKSIRREEERMAKFLERQIPALAKGVATEEIPAAERRARARRARAGPPAGQRRVGKPRLQLPHATKRSRSTGSARKPSRRARPAGPAALADTRSTRSTRRLVRPRSRAR